VTTEGIAHPNAIHALDGYWVGILSKMRVIGSHKYRYFFYATENNLSFHRSMKTVGPFNYSTKFALG